MQQRTKMLWWETLDQVPSQLKERGYKAIKNYWPSHYGGTVDIDRPMYFEAIDKSNKHQIIRISFSEIKQDANRILEKDKSLVTQTMHFYWRWKHHFRKVGLIFVCSPWSLYGKS